MCAIVIGLVREVESIGFGRLRIGGQAFVQFEWFVFRFAAVRQVEHGALRRTAFAHRERTRRGCRDRTVMFDTCRNDRYADLAIEIGIERRAPDDVRIFVDQFTDVIGRLVDFEQLHVLAADDRDDDALGAGHRHAVEQRIGDGALGSFESAVVAFAFAGAHHRLAHFAHHRTHVGEVEVDEPRHDHEVGNRPHALLQHLVGKHECFLEGRFGLGHQEQVLVGDDDQRIDVLLQLVDARFGRAHAARAFEQERLGHDADGQHALLARRFCDDGCGAGPGAAAHAGCDEDHVDAVHRVFDLFDRFFSRGLAHFGARARTEAARDVGAELDPLVGRRGTQSLRVGIGDDELDAFDLCLHHVGDRVAAGTTDAHDHDLGTKVVVRCRSDIDAHSRVPVEFKSRPWALCHNSGIKLIAGRSDTCLIHKG